MKISRMINFYEISKASLYIQVVKYIVSNIMLLLFQINNGQAFNERCKSKDEGEFLKILPRAGWFSKKFLIQNLNLI